ncbi:hypothetical protein [Streptomyces sp. NPDC088789]|uniref:SCO2583/SCO2584 N-terminal domain-containing protein n=1 Tax=Streptomyces sp. NPDC088789 TaxID=3365899 RepID=UPI0038202A9F
MEPGVEEYDLRWADDAEHREPSARARMLAARWKENPPGPVPFRPEPDGRRRARGRGKGRGKGWGQGRARGQRPRRGPGERRAWVSTAIILGSIAAVILLLGYIEFRAPF